LGNFKERKLFCIERRDPLKLFQIEFSIASTLLVSCDREKRAKEISFIGVYYLKYYHITYLKLQGLIEVFFSNINLYK
jgi:hypothetical protein